MLGRLSRLALFVWRRILRPPARVVANGVALACFSLLVVPVALVSRLARRPVDIGLGPEPLINNVYHKKALELQGYSAETFVDQVYFITSEFDYRGDLRIPRYLGFLRGYLLFMRALFRYRCLYIYFNGGPLMSKPLVWRVEPWLYRLAGIRVVVMPYGGDVQDLTRSRNLLYKHALSADYPVHRLRRGRISAQLDLWTRWADHVVSGVEWVDYMYHWDTLMLGHFSIDLCRWTVPSGSTTTSRPLRILHAPNHRNIKGTQHFVRAVEELQGEGVEVEITLLERVPNEVIHQKMADTDVVADQLVVGWYAMFALEAMAMGKPVLCYLREDLLRLYECAGLLEPGEMPIVNCDPLTVKAAIRHLAEHPEERQSLAERSRRFVAAHHSLESVGAVFDRINRSIGVMPATASREA